MAGVVEQIERGAAVVVQGDGGQVPRCPAGTATCWAAGNFSRRTIAGAQRAAVGHQQQVPAVAAVRRAQASVDRGRHPLQQLPVALCLREAQRIRRRRTARRVPVRVAGFHLGEGHAFPLPEALLPQRGEGDQGQVVPAVQDRRRGLGDAAQVAGVGGGEVQRAEGAPRVPAPAPVPWRLSGTCDWPCARPAAFQSVSPRGAPGTTYPSPFPSTCRNAPASRRQSAMRRTPMRTWSGNPNEAQSRTHTRCSRSSRSRNAAAAPTPASRKLALASVQDRPRRPEFLRQVAAAAAHRLASVCDVGTVGSAATPAACAAAFTLQLCWNLRTRSTTAREDSR